MQAGSVAVASTARSGRQEEGAEVAATPPDEKRFKLNEAQWPAGKICLCLAPHKKRYTVSARIKRSEALFIGLSDMAPVLIVVQHKEEIRFLDLLSQHGIIANSSNSFVGSSTHFPTGPSLSHHRP